MRFRSRLKAPLQRALVRPPPPRPPAFIGRVDELVAGSAAQSQQPSEVPPLPLASMPRAAAAKPAAAAAAARPAWIAAAAS